MSPPARALRYGVKPPFLIETLDDAAATAVEWAERLAAQAQADDCSRLTTFALAFLQLANDLGETAAEVRQEGSRWDWEE